MTEFEIGIKTIDVHELKNRMDKQQDLCLIDVRELDEWQAVHIPGSIHIPKDTIPSKLEAAVADKAHPIYLLCKGGIRSIYAAQSLIELGYNEVYSISGGIMEWARAGYALAE